MKDVYNQLEGMVCFDFVKKEDEISIENIQYVPLVNHYNDNVVTIYSLKEYTSTLASQHSILKDQADIIKEFKNYVKQMISNDDIDIEMWGLYEEKNKSININNLYGWWYWFFLS